MVDLASAPSRPETAPLSLQRARSRAAVAVARDETGQTRLSRLAQAGSAKLRLPRTHSPVPEAVLLNTAGGLASGDRLDVSAEVAAGASLALTTQTAERVYRARADEPPATVSLRLRVESGAALAWLPQETILFDGSRLARRLEVDLAADARLMALEALVFGRRAMGETVVSGALSDQWRVRVDGRLIHAEAFRLTPDGAAGLADVLARPVVAAGAGAIATLLSITPDGGDALPAWRAAACALQDPTAGLAIGVSAPPGRLVARFAARDGKALRRAISGFLLASERVTLPRVWSL